jgi:hypothetical protein
MNSEPGIPARPLAKQVAPIKAVAGVGVAVEDRVAAVGAAAMLLGRSPFAGFPGRLVRIGFQVRTENWHFDDLLFTFERDTGRYQVGASVRSKQEISRQSISADVKDALGAQFQQAEPNPFRRGIDRLALLAARHEPEVADAIRKLGHAALANPTTLPQRIGQGGAFNEIARTLYADLDAHFKAHAVPANAATAFAAFELVELDMADFERSEPAAGRQLCAELLHDPSDANVSGLWQALVAVAQEQKHIRGFLDLERVLVAVRHRFRLKAYPHDAPDWEIIGSESRGQLELVKETIAGVVVPRAAAKQTVSAAVKVHPITAVVGPSGCGKSSLVKQWLPESDYPVQVWTKASAWPRPDAGNLAAVLGLDGLKLDLAGLFTRVTGPGLLVIDAAEACVENPHLAQLERLLALAQPKNPESPWRVVLLVRTEDWTALRLGLARKAPDLVIHVEPLGDFEPVDVAVVTRAVPGLGPLVRQPRLETVLRKAKILSLVAEHLHAGGTMDPKDVAGESHLAQWWWTARVRTGKNAALRARAMEALAGKQAEHVQHAVRESDIDSTLLPALAELTHDGICVSRGDAVAVQHDLYTDWTRLQLLIREGDKWIDYAKARLASPLWHRAIRLYGILLLEQPNAGAAAWTAQVTALGAKDDASQVIADLFLEAPLLSAAPVENLRAVWPSLIAAPGNLLHRMLERMRQTGTFPNDHLIGLLQRQGGFTREVLLAHFRLPYPQYWLPLLIVLHEHKDRAAALAPTAVARAALAWLETVPRGWPGCREAAELAVAAARPFVDGKFVDGKHREVWFPHAEEEKVIYQALLAAVHDCPDDVARLARVLSGLLPPGGGTFVGVRRIITHGGFGPGQGVSHEVPPPWPGGPFNRSKPRFTELVLKSQAMDPVILANPALARELLLAAHIPERDVDDHYHRDRHEPDGMVFDDSFQPPFYAHGSFLRLLRANREEGRRLVVDLVNHYTARWAEWKRRPTTLQIDEGDLAQTWTGDGRIYLAYRGITHVHAHVASALMALEKLLLDRVDQGESIDEDIAYLLGNSRSLAIIGLLIAVGKRKPSLLFTELWPFVASPELQVTEHNSINPGFRDFARTPEVERKLIDEWDKLPEHETPLHEVCRQLLPYPEAIAKLTALAAHWRQLLAEPAKLRVDAFTLHKLAELFDPANWTKKKEGENEVWEYQAPPRLLAAAAKRREENQSDLMPLITVPTDCRTLLERGQPVPDEQLEKYYAYLDQVPDGNLYADDRKSILGSRADAQCSLVAMLVNLGQPWLERHPDKLQRCGEIIRQHLAQPPPSRSDLFDDIPFNRTWENFCAEAAPYFLARDPANLEWRAVVAELLSRPHLQTPRAILRRAAALKSQLGATFAQLFDLALWIAAARHVTDLTEYEKTGALDWNAWWEKTKTQFVAGTLPALPDDWSTITVGAGKGRHDNPQFGPPFKISLMIAALEALLLANSAGTPEERTHVHKSHQRLLAAILATVPTKLGKSERPAFPSNSIIHAMILLGAHLVQIEDAGARRAYWEPLLSRGVPATHEIEYFLQGFISTGARTPTETFAHGWQEIIAWAETAPQWKFARDRPHYEMRDLWRHLLGLDGNIRAAFGVKSSAVIVGLKDYYERWAGHNLRERASTQRFMNFLRLPATQPLLVFGLQWLDRAFDVPTDQRWGFRELASELADFLQWAWLQHEKEIRADAGAFAAFRRLLLRLCAEQEQTALALQAMLTSPPAGG